MVLVEEAHHIDDSNTSNHATLLWHYRLSHLNHQTMIHMARQHITLGFTLPRKSKLSLYEGFIFGKLSNSPFPSYPTTTTKPLQLVHTDICGPLSIPSLSENVYFLAFIDDFTRFTMVTFLKTKRSDQVLEKFKSCHKLVTNQ